MNYEHLTVDKNDPNLIGESRETTIIDGGSEDFTSVVGIAGDNVTFRGFATKVNAMFSRHIDVSEAVDTVISENNIAGRHYGIWVNVSSNITLIGKSIAGCDLGITLFNSSYVFASENNIQRADAQRCTGISLRNCARADINGQRVVF